MAAARFSGMPLEHLTDSNYLNWALKMESFLRRENLWSPISEAIPQNPDQVWIRKDEKCKASIILGVEENKLVHVRGLQASKELWNSLCDLYVKTTAGSKVILTKRLYKAHLPENGNLPERLHALQQNFMELEERGMEFTPLMKVKSSCLHLMIPGTF